MMEIFCLMAVIGCLGAIECKRIFNSFLSLLFSALSISFILILNGISITAFFIIISITAVIFSMYLIYSKIGKYEK